MRIWVTAFALAACVAAANYAQGAIQGSATYTSKPGTTDAFEYDLTLHNTGTTNIEVFWYAWDHSNINFLPFIPDNMKAPTNWFALPTYNYLPSQGYEYGIEWYGSALAPGQSLSGFSFESNMPPSFFASNSDAAPTFPVSTSWVYMNYPAQQTGDLGFEFTAAAVPEPASLGMVGLGALILLGLGTRRRDGARSVPATIMAG